MIVNSFMRTVASIAMVISLCGSVVACTKQTSQQKAAAQEQKAADERKKQDKKREGRLMDLVRSGHWNETRTPFTRDGHNYVFASTGQVFCSAKFELVLTAGKIKEHYILVAVMKQEEKRIADKNSPGVLVAALPKAFADNKKNLTKKKFEDLVRAHRKGNNLLDPICGDRR